MTGKVIDRVHSDLPRLSESFGRLLYLIKGANFPGEAARILKSGVFTPNFLGFEVALQPVPYVFYDSLLLFLAQPRFPPIGRLDIPNDGGAKKVREIKLECLRDGDEGSGIGRRVAPLIFRESSVADGTYALGQFTETQ